MGDFAEVRIDSGRPIFMSMDVKSFGEIFARTNDASQVAILRSCLLSVNEQFPTQIDYIGFELAKPENADLRKLLLYLVDEEFVQLLAGRDAGA